MRSDGYVIWLNGAFGAGKTTVARVLASRFPEALLFDPEDIGVMLSKVIPSTRRTSDFQDIRLWRHLTFTTIAGLLHEHGGRLVVPMTIAKPVCFDETVGRLRRSGMIVHHFTLVANPNTIRCRILRRLSRPRATRWALRQVDRCASALESPLFATHIGTDGISVRDVVAAILRQLPSMQDQTEKVRLR